MRKKLLPLLAITVLLFAITIQISAEPVCDYYWDGHHQMKPSYTYDDHRLVYPAHYHQYIDEYGQTKYYSDYQCNVFKVDVSKCACGYETSNDYRINIHCEPY